MRVAAGDEAAEARVMSAAGMETGWWTRGLGPWMELSCGRPSARGLQRSAGWVGLQVYAFIPCGVEGIQYKAPAWSGG